jgi:hypothetical protein
VLGFAGAILVLLIFASVANVRLFGKQVSGWSWAAAYVLSIGLMMSRKVSVPAFPLFFWLPWSAVVLAGIGHHEDALQNAGQLLCPLAVGTAASMLRPDRGSIAQLILLFRVAASVCLVAVLSIRLPMLLGGQLPEVTGLAVQSIAAVMFQSVFLAFYLVLGRACDLLLYLLCAALPIIAVTRGPFAASFLLALLCLCPMTGLRRTLLIAGAITVGLCVFYSARFQQKMFYHGKGTIQDLILRPEAVRQTARDVYRASLRDGFDERPWFGHGGNADATHLKQEGFAEGFLPHNDWYRLLYNYGRIGLGLFLVGMVAQVWHARLRLRLASPEIRACGAAGFAAFVPLAFLMFTDNVLMYAQYFGNVQFLLLGMAYAGGAWQRKQRAGEAPAIPRPQIG